MIGRVVNSAHALEVKTLATVLNGCQIGETLTYERLTNAINRDVRNGAFAVLHRARQVVLRDNRIVFDVVRGFGLKRLNDIEIVNTGDHNIRKVRRAIRRGVNTLNAADYEHLPNESRVAYNVHQATFGLMSFVTDRRQQNTLNGAVKHANAALPPMKSLEVFGNK